MLSSESQSAPPHALLKLISATNHVPEGEVTRIYEDELARLSAQASITCFVPIFAIRNVEETLRHRDATGSTLTN